MFPVYEEIYQQVDRPAIFINTWHFHWPDNIVRMQRLIGNITETGMYRSYMRVRKHSIVSSYWLAIGYILQ